MDADYYRYYYTIERKHWWFRAREAILCRWIAHTLGARAEKRNLRVLNVGAATGRSSEWLARFGEVVSVEYDPGCCQLLHQQLGMHPVQASLEALPFADGGFDLVCAFDVLEHLRDDRAGAAELMRMCAPDGWLFVTVPAFPFLWSRHDEVNQHFRRYRLPTLRDLLAQSGGSRPTFCGYFNFWLFPLVATVRMLQKFLRRLGIAEPEVKSDFAPPKGGLGERLLERLFRSEWMFFRAGIAPPFGVSAFAVIHKQDRSRRH